MAVNCAILSYNGMVYFGFSGDIHIAPDLRRLENFLETSFTELRQAAGIRPHKKSRKKTPQRKAPAVSKVSPGQEKKFSVPAQMPVVHIEEKPVATPDPAVAKDKVPSQMIA